MMIFNEHLDRLMEVQIVKDFVQHHRMQAKMCIDDDNYSFVLYRYPYVIVFWDALIENYLEMWFFEFGSGLMIRASTLSGVCLDMHLQNIEELCHKNLDHHAQNSIFLSDSSTKMFCLYEHLEAIDKLLPLIEAKGGLTSMRDGTFDNRFNFSDCIQPIPHIFKERYNKCLGFPVSP